jgi:hypothetical protein
LVPATNTLVGVGRLAFENVILNCPLNNPMLPVEGAIELDRLAIGFTTIELTPPSFTKFAV